MGLRVLEPGLYSLLVGRGRVGTRHLGVPVGGPADVAACAMGNALVGNEADALALEASLRGPSLVAEQPVAAVVFGAPFQLSSSTGQALEVGRTFNLAVGETLKIGGTPMGCRAYLCVAGGFDGKEILGSESALEPVRKGEVLACRSSAMRVRSPVATSFQLVATGRANENSRSDTPPTILATSWKLVATGKQTRFRDADDTLVLRVLPGLQRDWFDVSPFFTQTYTVSEASNRMGLRLKGTPLLRPPQELASEPVAPGGVQITNDGLPVILGVDGQTIGGYPKIAHVIRADLDSLGQLRPGDRVGFVEVSFADAENAYAEARPALRKMLARWRAGASPEFG